MPRPSKNKTKRAAAERAQVRYLTSYNNLLKYCEKYGIEVIECANKTSELEFEPSKSLELSEIKITINSNNSNEIKTYALLHELGHILLMNDKKYKRRFSKKIREMDIDEKDTSPRSHIHRLEIIQEELDAWERGIMLAEKLQILINKRNIKKYKTKCLVCYIRFLWGE